MTENDYEKIKSILKTISPSIDPLRNVKDRYSFTKEYDDSISLEWDPSCLAFKILNYQDCGYHFDIFMEPDGDGITTANENHYKSIDIDTDTLNDILEFDLTQIRLMNKTIISDISSLSYFLDKVNKHKEEILKDLLEFCNDVQ